jgi:hypothetical protein
LTNTELVGTLCRGYLPQFTITSALLSCVKSIAASRERGSVWESLLLRPLIKADLVKRMGIIKTGRYVLK